MAAFPAQSQGEAPQKRETLRSLRRTSLLEELLSHNSYNALPAQKQRLRHSDCKKQRWLDIHFHTRNNVYRFLPRHILQKLDDLVKEDSCGTEQVFSKEEYTDKKYKEHSDLQIDLVRF